MSNPFHDPHLAHVVRAVASQRVQGRPQLMSPDDLHLARDVFAKYVKLLDVMLETGAHDPDLRQARPNCETALSYIDAIAFDPTTIDKGIITALVGWLEGAVHLAEMSAHGAVPNDERGSDRVREILKSLQ